MSIGLPPPVFGRRMLHRVVFESSTNSEGTTVVPFSVIESQAGFTETHQAGLMRWSMPSASTAGGYADMILARPLRRDNFSRGGVEALLLFTSIAGAGTEQFLEIGLLGDASETARDNDYYLLEVHYNGNQLRLWNRVGGTFNNLTNASVTWTAADWYIRFAILGRRCYGKAWLASNPEPATWDIEWDDTTSLSAMTLGAYHVMMNGGNDGATTFTQDVKEFTVWECSAPIEPRLWI